MVPQHLHTPYSSSTFSIQFYFIIFFTFSTFCFVSSASNQLQPNEMISFETFDFIIEFKMLCWWCDLFHYFTFPFASFYCVSVHARYMARKKEKLNIILFKKVYLSDDIFSKYKIQTGYDIFVVCTLYRE